MQVVSFKMMSVVGSAVLHISAMGGYYYLCHVPYPSSIPSVINQPMAVTIAFQEASTQVTSLSSSKRHLPEKSPSKHLKKPAINRHKSTPSLISTAPVPKPSSGQHMACQIDTDFANAMPIYPDEARIQRQQGRVWLRLVVGVDGRVKERIILKSSGFACLDESAYHTVKEWRFLPARLGRQVVEEQIDVPIDFMLEDNLEMTHS